jgi:hypothetical protein
MPDRYADLSFENPDGADFSLVWVKGGRASISVGGDQPMDQPPCAITLDRARLIKLAGHIVAGLAAVGECEISAVYAELTDAYQQGAL